jgi:hypothetical protein
MEKKEKEPRGFYVEKGSFFAHAAVTVLALSIVARFLGTMALWGQTTRLIMLTLLPVGCALLFIVFIILLGRVALWLTILPVLGGAAFFILSVFEEGPGWSMFICIALAFLAAFVYTATLSGMIRTKWLIVPIFALIFAYQIYRAFLVFRDTQTPVSFAAGMARLSSLGLVFAMLCATLAFRRKKSVKTEVELPKIKDPVVVADETAPVGETASDESAEAPEDNTAAPDQTPPETAPTDVPPADAEEQDASDKGTEESL